MLRVINEENVKARVKDKLGSLPTAEYVKYTTEALKNELG